MTMTEETTESTPRVQDVLVGEMPVMKGPADPIVHLPRGLFLGNNVWATEAEVRELNGEDEEYLARFKELSDYYDQLIARGTVRIGAHRLEEMSMTERAALLGKLLIGERDMLMVAISRMTYGDKKTYKLTCPKCEAEFEFDLLLSEDIKFREVEDIQRTTYAFASRGGEIEYRIFTGEDQQEALRYKGNDAERNTLLISRAIVRVNGSILADPIGYAKRMAMQERAAFLLALTEHQPSANFIIDIPCISCGEVQPSTFAWWDFFRP